MITRGNVPPSEVLDLDFEIVEAIFQEIEFVRNQELSLIRWLGTIIVNTAGKATKSPVRPSELMKIGDEGSVNEDQKRIWQARNKRT